MKGACSLDALKYEVIEEESETQLNLNEKCEDLKKIL